MRLFYSRSILLFVFCCLAVQTFSQADVARKRVRFSVNAAVLANKSFSHYNKSIHKDPVHYSSSPTRIKINNNYKPGFCIGFGSEFGRSRTVSFILGLSVSVTQAEYRLKESYYVPSPEFYVNRSKYAEVRVLKTMTLANLEAGCKIKLLKKLYFQHSFLIQKVVYDNDKQTGTLFYNESSYYPDSPQAPANYAIRTTEPFNKTSGTNTGLIASVKLMLSYKLNQRYEVFVSRSAAFTMHYRLPLWGAGLAVNL